MAESKRHSYTVGEEDLPPGEPGAGWPAGRLWWWIRLVASFMLFLLALEWMSMGMRLFGKESLDSLILLTNDPFLSLFLGILITAIVQSSSTVTTMVVGLVASGTMPMQAAVPLVMGANIGTSITCMVVALGLIRQRKEFGRGITTAALHSLFNMFAVLVLFPIEISTHALSRATEGLAGLLYSTPGVVTSTRGLLDVTTRPIAQWVVNLSASEGFPAGNPYLVIFFGVFSLFLALRILIISFESVVHGKVNKGMNQYLFGHPRQAFLTGLVSTSILQSSSVTTSLLVPVTASTHIALPRVMAFLVGANIGTTVTALLAAFILGSSSVYALAIAFVHLFFNVIGAILLYPVPWIRKVPIWLASQLGKLSRDYRFVPVVYLVVVYFLLPVLLILLA